MVWCAAHSAVPLPAVLLWTNACDLAQLYIDVLNLQQPVSWRAVPSPVYVGWLSSAGRTDMTVL